jgi:hypothetical protein
MDVGQIKGMGGRWNKFLGEFDACFGRGEPRTDLRAYVREQLSNLKRKSLEPIGSRTEKRVRWFGRSSSIASTPSPGMRACRVRRTRCSWRATCWPRQRSNTSWPTWWPAETQPGWSGCCGWRSGAWALSGALNRANGTWGWTTLRCGRGWASTGACTSAN